MSALAEIILKHARSLPEGGTVSPKEFLHLASRSAVARVIGRLTREEQLFRIWRGAYAAPVTSRFGTRPPAPATVVEALRQSTGETIVPHGAAAANAMGLTTQVPITEVFLTSGPNRTLTLRKRTILVRHAPSWQLALGGRAGMAIRATWWIGPAFANKTIKSVRRLLSQEEWAEIVASRAILPAWMAKALDEICNEEASLDD